jgi:Temperature dependent protein affecting M2 dsRNA replication
MIPLLTSHCSLPFLTSPSCALGLAVNAYFMGLAAESTPTAPETKARFKKRAPKDLFEFCLDYPGDMNKAFGLWDAIAAGIAEAGPNVAGRENVRLFQEVDGWVKEWR